MAALADRGDVRVRRSDGVPLLLVREDSASSAADGALSAARALRNALAHLSAEAAADTLVEEFPWVDLLPEADRRQFVADFVRAVGASAELGRWSVLAQVLVEWKATAAIHADPALVEELTQPLGDDRGPVPPPDGSCAVPAKRGDRVAPPARPDGWEARFATSEAAKGWEELCRVARAGRTVARLMAEVEN